jgi:hypothetical protein
LPFNPLFPKKATLMALLPEHGIEYRHLAGLGNKFKDVPDMAESKRLYQNDIIHAADFKKLTDFARDNGAKMICLLCYCNTVDPAKCHRFWLKELLECT